MSFSLMSQNRTRKSSGSDKNCGSFLSRHRSDAQGALRQSLIFRSDMDKIMHMSYNDKCEVTLGSVLPSELLRPFTQLFEQTRNNYLLIFLIFAIITSLSLLSLIAQFCLSISLNSLFTKSQRLCFRAILTIFTKADVT